jgi:hypothetical protein
MTQGVHHRAGRAYNQPIQFVHEGNRLDVKFCSSFKLIIPACGSACAAGPGWVIICGHRQRMHPVAH